MTIEAATQLEKLFCEELGVRAGRIDRGQRLVEDLGLDSVAFAVGLVAIEERFGVALTEEQLFDCDTFGDLADIVEAGIAGVPS